MTIDYRDIEAAAERLRGYVRRTPADRWAALSAETGAEVYLKCEHLQHTGSFKFRGALNTVLSLSDEERARGVIAASTGNHGMAVARAARLAGAAATVYVAATASPAKLAGIEALGADIVKVAGDPLAAELTARRASEDSGQVFISPYNDPRIIAGQGTIGLELAEQVPDLDAVFVSVGGGGLIAGIASYLKAVKPGVEIVGCWPENAPVMHVCMERGEIVEVAETPTISDGTAGGIEPGAITLPLCRELIDKDVLVSEGEIAGAMKRLAEDEHWMVEGAAGVAIAAFCKVAADYRGKSVALVLCGRNITLEKFLGAVG